MNNLRKSKEQTITSKVLMVPGQRGIDRISPYKNIKLTVTSRGISFRLSSNNTPSSPPYSVGIKIKEVPEE